MRKLSPWSTFENIPCIVCIISVCSFSDSRVSWILCGVMGGDVLPWGRRPRKDRAEPRKCNICFILFHPISYILDYPMESYEIQFLSLLRNSKIWNMLCELSSRLPSREHGLWKQTNISGGGPSTWAHERAVGWPLVGPLQPWNGPGPRPCDTL